MDIGFCVTNGLVEQRKKLVFGAALIKKRKYWTANIKGDTIDAHFASREVGNVDSVKQVEDGVAYHVFFMKDPDYVMKLMTIYGPLEPKDKKTHRNFKLGGVMEVVANHFLYRQKVDEKNNRRYAPIYIYKTWATKYWPYSCFAWYLAVS